LLLSSGLAAADPATGETPPSAGEPVLAPPSLTKPESVYSVGFRVGGYGFRRTEGDVGANQWNECRMNGLGVFVDRTVRGPWFAEAGLDTYFSIGQGEPTDLPVDRQSALLSFAGGVRTHLASWLGVYAQLGAGVELARLSVPYAGATLSADKAMPDGFFGGGVDARILRGWYVGAAFRMLVMGNFDYHPDQLTMSNQWVAPPPTSQVFSATPDLAAQGQFYIRRDL
jgi:hypothetical protein